MKQEIKDEINNIGRGYGVTIDDDVDSITETLDKFWDFDDEYSSVNDLKGLIEYIGALTKRRDLKEAKEQVNALFWEINALREFYDSDIVEQEFSKELMWGKLKK